MRPSLDEVMMAVALMLSRRATCRKRKVGCVLVDSRGLILSTGYNGNPSGLPHCIDAPCVGANQPAGSDTCQAVHAELNALLACRDVHAIHTCYVTVAPCNNCLKTLLNTSCQRIVYAEGEVLRAWHDAGRESVKID